MSLLRTRHIRQQQDAERKMEKVEQLPMRRPPSEMQTDSETASLRDLCKLAYGHGMTQFGYRTGHSRKLIESRNYWEDAIHIVEDGDFLFVKHLDPLARGSSLYAFRIIDAKLRAVPLLSTFGSGEF
jgi:hypothetical protein